MERKRTPDEELALRAIAELSGPDVALRDNMLRYYNGTEFLHAMGKQDDVKCIGIPYARGWKDCLKYIFGSPKLVGVPGAEKEEKQVGLFKD